MSFPKKIFALKAANPDDHRVPLTPQIAGELVAQGFEVFLEQGAGCKAFFPDDAYKAVGVHLWNGSNQWVQEALHHEQNPVMVWTLGSFSGYQFPKGSLIVGTLSGKHQKSFLKACHEKQWMAFDLERLPRISRAQGMDVLSSQNNLYGYYASLLAASSLSRVFPMFTTSAGQLPCAHVFVLGVGVAGLQAIATCARLGAKVTAFDIRPETQEQAQGLGADFLETSVLLATPEDFTLAGMEPFFFQIPHEKKPRTILSIYKRFYQRFFLKKSSSMCQSIEKEGFHQEKNPEVSPEKGNLSSSHWSKEQKAKLQKIVYERQLKSVLQSADVVICSAFGQGRRPVCLLKEQEVSWMKPSSLILDLAVDYASEDPMQNTGNCVYTRFGQEVQTPQGVRVMGPSHGLNAVSHQASMLYAKNLRLFLDVLCTLENPLEDPLMQATYVNPVISV